LAIPPAAIAAAQIDPNSTDLLTTLIIDFSLPYLPILP
jgi:hypothetical protein